MSTSEQLNAMLEEMGISITIYDYGMREPKIVIDTFRHDKQVREEVIEGVIKTLAKSEDTMLSDKQYYTLMELKGE